MPCDRGKNIDYVTGSLLYFPSLMGFNLDLSEYNYYILMSRNKEKKRILGKECDGY